MRPGKGPEQPSEGHGMSNFMLGAGRAATSSLLIYQRSYLLGRKARVRDES